MGLNGTRRVSCASCGAHLLLHDPFYTSPGSSDHNDIYIYKKGETFGSIMKKSLLECVAMLSKWRCLFRFLLWLVLNDKGCLHNWSYNSLDGTFGNKISQFIPIQNHFIQLPFWFMIQFIGISIYRPFVCV